MIPFYEIQPDRLKIIHNKRELFFPSHIHENIEILYVYEGTQHLSIRNINYEVAEGEIIIIFPNLLHQYYKDNQKYADGLLIICDPKIFLDMFPDLTNSVPKNPVIKKDSLNKEALFALNSIKDERPFPIKLGFVYIIMQHIIQNIEIEKKSEPNSENITKKVIEYIAKNFTNPISLDTIAKTFYVNKYYISRIFSENINMSFRNYIGLIRAEYASKLIRMTNSSLTEISDSSGFESIRTFNRVFHKIYGMSPRDYKYSVNKLKK